MQTEIRLLIVDAQIIVRSGVRSLLSAEQQIRVIGEAAYASDALHQAAYLKPDVILINLRLPDMAGLETLEALRRVQPGCKMVVLTDLCDEQHVRGAVQAGASGYLLLDAGRNALVQAINAAMQGTPTLHPEAQRILMRQLVNSTAKPSANLPKLTERDRDVLRLLTQGKSNRDIAANLYLTEGTVKGYVSAILSKLNVADRTQAVLFALKHQLA